MLYEVITVRLVLEPRSSRQDPEEFMRLMLSHTSLEENFSVNLVVLGLDGRPGRKNIRELLEEWVQFRVATVTRRTKYRLSQVERRLHILEGRRIVFLNIDKVIRITSYNVCYTKLLRAGLNTLRSTTDSG